MFFNRCINLSCLEAAKIVIKISRQNTIIVGKHSNGGGIPFKLVHEMLFKRINVENWLCVH